MVLPLIYGILDKMIVGAALTQGENMKRCCRCEGEFPETDFYFSQKYRRDGTRRRMGHCRRCSVLKVRAWVEKNRFRVSLNGSRASAKQNGYLSCSATEEEIEAAFTGKCHFCGKLEEENYGRKLGIDHDHETGEFRGWLCAKCNTKDVLAECA